MLLEVVDDRGEVIARSRDLTDLRKRLKARIAEASVALADAFEGQVGLQHWTVGRSEVPRTVRRGGWWSALVPESTEQSWPTNWSSKDAADAATRASCARFWRRICGGFGSAVAIASRAKSSIN